MTELLALAIERLRTLSPEIQNDVARVVLRIPEADEGAAYRFTPEEEADLDEAEDEAARGDFATDDEIMAVLAPRRA